MLLAIESYFHDALRAAMPESVEVSAGPSRGPSPEIDAGVEVFATRMRLALPEGDDLTALRQPSYFSQVVRWAGDGTRKDFALPANTIGQVVEVESPPGRPLRRGDDYLVEESTLRLYRAPATASEAVVAYLRGSRAAGFLERRRCEVRLTIRVWVKTDVGDATPLMSRALAAALAASADMGNMEDANTEPETSGVRLRLLQPQAALVDVHQSLELEDGTAYFRAQANFLVRGELEQLVSLGTPESEGIILEVRRET
ncbi:hypothetical protein SAMN05443572_103353 [Myxococcus fulvus]|uniref:Uncharacterized protein n=1 Tax=Myxococcus fulvus TaxID=33 RepID=A0A511T8W2_MYXFU|nr:hypothetical protein [Myxococcus fulvus]GEN10477.1 hypothetical protein MFU01_55140 [Myxococcus fulvus]SET81729.1 hypothetical protein SAMN05443572_103353 [Myxococcus fulvus]